jgi:hypothetical protein
MLISEKLLKKCEGDFYYCMLMFSHCNFFKNIFATFLANHIWGFKVNFYLFYFGYIFTLQSFKAKRANNGFEKRKTYF